MLKQHLIPGTSLRTSSLALGTMAWGTKVPLPRAAELYELYRAAGGNVVDTAHIYAAWETAGAGASERTINDVLRLSQDRRQIVLITKGGHPAESFYPHPEHYLSPDTIRSDIRESLERMGVQNVDLFFLHRDDRRVPIGEILGILNEQVAEGRIRYFGASNWGVDRLEEANRFAAGRGGDMMGFVASQPEFSLAHPNADPPTTDPALRFLMPEDVAWHERSRLPVFCYSPTAKGYLATGGTRGSKKYDNDASRQRLARIQELARQQLVTPTQVALAWLMHQTFPCIPILGTGDASHLREALGSESVSLTPDQVRWLRDGTPISG